MTNKPATTTDQLRALMSKHTANTAVLSPPTPKPVDVPVVAQPRIVPNPAVEPRLHSRHTVQLMQAELARINVIINNTNQQIGERATVTDVLRTALKRLGDSSYISKEEMNALRMADGRRAKLRKIPV
jgi:hypothetical protein